MGSGFGWTNWVKLDKFSSQITCLGNRRYFRRPTISHFVLRHYSYMVLAIWLKMGKQTWLSWLRNVFCCPWSFGQWNEGKYNSCLSCRLSRFWFEFNPAKWQVVSSRWCCCNVKNQKKISTKSFTFQEYERRILRVQLTQLDDQRAPGGAKQDALLLLSFIFCRISLIYISSGLFVQLPPVIGSQSPWRSAPTCFDILKQGPFKVSIRQITGSQGQGSLRSNA